MLLTGVLSTRYGSRPLILAGGFGLLISLPWLAVAASPVSLGLSLFGFGAALGSLDTAMNIHAVEVERTADRPLMSGFHAFFSIGGFAGATVITAILSWNVSPFATALFGSLLMAIAMLVATPRLPRTSQTEATTLFVVPHGIVLMLALLTAVMFLVEGAILDWSALLITEKGLVGKAQGGLGYSIFAIAMTVGRLSGDFVARAVGDRAILYGSGLAAMAGFALLLAAPIPAVAMSGFLLIGLGASNVVPVLIRGAGTQRAMPAGLAVAAITTIGYLGILLGPAAIGFIASMVGLPAAFWLLALLLSAVVLSARAVTPEQD
jgi:MFS family permease